MNEGIRKEYLDGTRRHGCVRFPVEKFLRSRLGQLWSEVHSELSKEFDRRTYAGYRFWRSFDGQHWWSHQDVATGCWIGAETGTIYNSLDKRVEGFYVHPFTGLLCHQDPKIKIPTPPYPVERIIIEHHDIKIATWKECGVFYGRAYEKLEGIWYYTEYRQNDYYYPYGYRFPYSEEKPYTVIDKSKRQLSRKELRKINATNNTPEEIVEIKKEIDKKAAERIAKVKELMEKTHGSH
jgi:hypothetical protein